MGFSRQEGCSGLPFPSPGISPTQGSNPCLLYLLHWQPGSLPWMPPGNGIIIGFMFFCHCFEILNNFWMRKPAISIFQWTSHVMQVALPYKLFKSWPIKGRRRRGDGGWDGWMASLTQWTWVWASSGSWWWTGKPGMLQSMGSQSRTPLNAWTELNSRTSLGSSAALLGSIPHPPCISDIWYKTNKHLHPIITPKLLLPVVSSS